MQLVIVTVYESGVRIAQDEQGKDIETPIERQLAEYLVRMTREDTGEEITDMILKRHQNGWFMGDRAEITVKLTSEELSEGYAIDQTIDEWHPA